MRKVDCGQCDRTLVEFSSRKRKENDLNHGHRNMPVLVMNESESAGDENNKNIVRHGLLAYVHIVCSRRVTGGGA